MSIPSLMGSAIIVRIECWVPLLLISVTTISLSSFIESVNATLFTTHAEKSPGASQLKCTSSKGGATTTSTSVFPATGIATEKVKITRNYAIIVTHKQ